MSEDFPNAAPQRPAGRSGERPLSGERAQRRSLALDAVRYVLPACVIVAGLVVMALGGESDLEGGAGIVSAGLAIFFINWLFRIGAAGERERDAEDAAREHFERHGRWPD